MCSDNCYYTSHEPDIFRQRAPACAAFVMVALGIWFCVLMFIPFINAGGYGTELPQNLLAWMVVVLCAITVCLFYPGGRPVVTATWLLWLSGAVLLTLPVLWAPESVWLTGRAPGLLGLWGSVAFYLALLQCRFSPGQRQWIWGFIVISSVVECGVVIQDFFYPDTLPPALMNILLTSGRMATGSFQQVNVTASYLATGLAVAMLMLAGRGGGSLRFSAHSGRTGDGLLVLSMFLISGILVLLQSRTGWVGGIAAYVILLILYGVRKNIAISPRRGMALFISPVVGSAVGMMLLHSPGGLVARISKTESNYQRLLTLKETWSMIRLHPWKGWGMGSFEYQFQSFLAALPGGNPGHELMAHPHNEILYAWMEGGMAGLLGCLVFTAAFIVLIRKSRGIYRADAKTCAQSLPGWPAMLPVLIHTQTEFPLYYSATHAMVLVILAVVIDTRVVPAWRPGPRRSRITGVFSAAGRAGGGLMLCYFLWLLARSLMAGFVLSRAELRMPGGEVELRALSPPSWLTKPRYEYDMHILDLAEFNATHRQAFLWRFLHENAEWLRYRDSPDASYNQILVLRYLGQHTAAETWRKNACRRFPWDKRFQG